MPKIYATHRSRATRNYWLAAEIGLTLEPVQVLQAYRLADPHAADAPLNTLSPAFLAISPAGAIPVLDDDGFILAESLVINLYLARKYGGDLGPRDAQEDALMQQWTMFGATSIESHALALGKAYNDGKVATPEDAAIVAATVASLQRPLKTLDAHLAAHGHVVGGRFTVADINVAEVVRYAQPHPTLIAGFPHVAGWLAACHARPGFQTMWAARLAEPT